MTSEKKIAIWIFITAAAVFAMAIIGAVTRLTESGLSMVEWRPLIGAIPPLSEAEWSRVFAIYQQTPEFQQKNFWMSIDDFKHIFFWEWFHRFWGRLIGLIYALPLIWFWVTKQIPQGYHGKLLAILGLGVGQAVMGWYMVESGLVDTPAVSHYRLAAHLSLAFLIFSCLIWVGLDLWHKNQNVPQIQYPKNSMILGFVSLIFLTITIVWGAFVAGLDGGLVYNTWPHMGQGTIIPHEIQSTMSLISDPVGVQFFHRWIAIVTAIIILIFAWRVKSFPLAGMTFLQVGLGIATLLTQVSLPLATLHQGGALILLGLTIYEIWKIKRSEPKSLYNT